MRQGCFDVTFESRPVTDGAIARPGEWSKVTITVRAARIIAVAQRDASTPRRRRQRTQLWLLIHASILPCVARTIRTRASSGYNTLYIALRPLSSHPGQLSTIAQPATPALRPTCMEIRTDSLRSACLRT